MHVLSLKFQICGLSHMLKTIYQNRPFCYQFAKRNHLIYSRLSFTNESIYELSLFRHIHKSFTSTWPSTSDMFGRLRVLSLRHCFDYVKPLDSKQDHISRFSSMINNLLFNITVVIVVHLYKVVNIFFEDLNKLKDI